MSLEKNLSVLTTIPEKALIKLHKHLNLIHSNDVVMELLKRDVEHSDDPIGIETFEGTIYLTVEDDILKYKFIPSQEFNNLMIKSFVDRDSALVTEVNNALKNALCNTYKDIL